jgi:hypothetical protein
MRTQDREVQCRSRDKRKLFERQCYLGKRHGSLAQEEGGQGVLSHRKGQGLRANRVRRQDDKALAIVS